MDLKRARELIGKESEKYDDEQLQKLIDDVSFFAQAAVDKLRKMTKKELEELLKKK
jgi:hypothetical protein